MSDLDDEKVFHGKRDIDYLFYEGAENSPYLLIVFQAIPSAKNNYEKIYGYIRTLANVNFHRLYIKDKYGLLGSYYMCENMNFEIEESVAMLIDEYMKKYGIRKENVITCGSSKGGTGALYFAAKYGLGHAICGAPQTRVGSFICAVNEETAKYMMGDELPEQNVEFMNRIVLRQINPDCKTDIRILTSESDGQFKNHIVPLITRANECGVKLDITADERVKCHHDIARYYQEYLVRNIFDIVVSDLKIKKPVIEIGNDGFDIKNAYDAKGRYKFVSRFVGDRNTDIANDEITSNNYEYVTKEIVSGTLILDFYVQGELWMQYRAADVVLDMGYFKYDGYEVDVDYENRAINLTVLVSEEKARLRYSYNLTLKNEKVIPSFSSDDKVQSFPVDASGSYKITFSIGIKNVGKVKVRTPAINVSFDKPVDKA